MKNLVAFFEIPAADFDRAVRFYETILSVKLSVYEEEVEKMACFPEENGLYPGSISFAAGFKPSSNGVLVSLNCEDMEATLACIRCNSGTVITPKTKVVAEGRGYFAVFADSEGSRVGLYSDK